MERPKRRKYKDNPYTLNYDEKTDTYSVSLKNNINVVSINVNKEIYEAFNTFELDDLSEMNEFDNHIEHLEIDENSLYNRGFIKKGDILEQVLKKINMEKLYNEINKLPLIQRKRLKMYYFENLNIYEIAIIEKCSYQAIDKSIKLALKELNKNLNL